MKNILSTLLLVLGLTSFGFAEGKGGYKVGDEAMDFNLLNVNGKFISLGIYKEAKGFIVVFTCDHCPYAKAYQERIKELSKIYSPQGYMVIAINSNDVEANASDSYDSMKVRAKDARFNFPYLYDEDQHVATTYGATNTPHVYVLQKQGFEKTNKMMVRYIGAIDDNYEDASKVKNKYVQDAVNSLLKHEYPKVENTKAIGCTIKWKKKK